jgi:hypothetical protein
MTRSAESRIELDPLAQQLLPNLTPDSYDAIAERAQSYRATTEAVDLSVRLGASEDVLRARLALAECLMDVGWRPSPQILASIQRDEDLLMQSNGALEPTAGRSAQTSKVSSRSAGW